MKHDSLTSLEKGVQGVQPEVLNHEEDVRSRLQKYKLGFLLPSQGKFKNSSFLLL
jgi:hypothetical protein